MADSLDQHCHPVLEQVDVSKAISNCGPPKDPSPSVRLDSESVSCESPTIPCSQWIGRGYIPIDAVIFGTANGILCSARPALTQRKKLPPNFFSQGVSEAWEWTNKFHQFSRNSHRGWQVWRSNSYSYHVSCILHFSYKVATRHGMGTLLGSFRLVVGNPGTKEM